MKNLNLKLRVLLGMRLLMKKKNWKCIVTEYFNLKKKKKNNLRLFNRIIKYCCSRLGRLCGTNNKK